MTTATATLEDLFGEVIHCYTRQQAIEDGVLMDVSAYYGDMVREAGIRIPVAMTATSFLECVCPIEGEGEQLAPCQDAEGRLWDVLWMGANAMRGAGDSSQVLFKLYVVPNVPEGSKRNPRSKLVALKAVCGPDDNGDPCITIMYLHED